MAYYSKSARTIILKENDGKTYKAIARNCTVKIFGLKP